MALAKTLTETNYYVSKDVKRQFEHALHVVVKGNQDRIFVVDGREGLGKSTLAMQLAYLVDKSFNIDRIAFNATEFERILKKADNYQAIVFDEAFNGLSSKSALSKENKRLVQILMECRQRNLFIFIVLPSIFLLEKYVAIFRSQALFHVFAPKKYGMRRYYRIFNYVNKKTLYLYGKKLMSYNRPRVNKTHRFYGKIPEAIAKEAYDKKKHNAFKGRIEKEEETTHKWKLQRDVFAYTAWKYGGIKQKDLAKISDLYDCAIKRTGITEICSTVSKNVKSQEPFI